MVHGLPGIILNDARRSKILPVSCVKARSENVWRVSGRGAPLGKLIKIREISVVSYIRLRGNKVSN